MPRIHQSLTELIGHTPLLELHRYRERTGAQARIIGKLEYLNPARSVKDRIAWAIIEDAEARGDLHPGQLIVDLTSGNTGIALAAIAAARGYRTKFYSGDNISPDKLTLFHAFGAENVQIPNTEFVKEGARDRAIQRLHDENPDAFFSSQGDNPSNPKRHYATTGPEVWEDTDGAVDILVGGVGTGGTISGTGRYLKERNPDVRVVVAEPAPESVPSPEHPYPLEIDGVHKVSGVDPALVPSNFDHDVPDEIIPVRTEDAYAASRLAAHVEGLLVGISAGAILHVATELAKRPENEGKVIVAVLPDTGERYLSTPLYEEDNS